MSMTFQEVIRKFNQDSVTQSYKGRKFEQLLVSWFKTAPAVSEEVEKVWMWNDFPGRRDNGSGKDVGIDLVVKSRYGEYWAVQCKCYDPNTAVTYDMVAHFVTASGKDFVDEHGQTCRFARRYFISTTNKFIGEAKNAFEGQNPPMYKINSQFLGDSGVDWEKLLNGIEGQAARSKEKSLLTHQATAIEKAKEYYIEQNHERGKLIMACGTGKTYTSLKMMEALLPNEKGLVLFCVPSIALLGQSLNAWFQDSKKPLKAICVCSDSRASAKMGSNDDDDVEETLADLAAPASTNVETIAKQMMMYKSHDGLVVVFSTYQSLNVVSDAQKIVMGHTKEMYGTFDFIICDEAHRTASVIAQNANESNFTKVHDNGFLKAKKRLYMTATPKIYGLSDRDRTTDNNITSYGMENASIYGDIIHKVNFAYAVSNHLLTDYKVMVIAVAEGDTVTERVEDGKTGRKVNVVTKVNALPEKVKKEARNENNKELDVSTAAKYIGILKGLSKQMVEDDKLTREIDPNPIRRAMIFTDRIGAEDRVETSKNIAVALPKVATAYREEWEGNEEENVCKVEVKHVDGSMGSEVRNEMLQWLREGSEDENACRVLSNVRCLSEGVDVPALDCVVFMKPKKSEIDVVQSIGRVMRTFKKGLQDEKRFGYIILPVAIPEGGDPVNVMDDNKRFKHVWQILQALRAHDDNFEATINTLPQNKVKITVYTPKGKTAGGDGNGVRTENEPDESSATEMSRNFVRGELFPKEMQEEFYAKIVEKVGDREYWGKWGEEIGKLASRFKTRIRNLVDEEDGVKMRFEKFTAALRHEINDTIKEEQVIEMLSQHLVMWKVFDAIFKEYKFTQNNPVSKAMTQMVQLFNAYGFEKETKELDDFYENVRATCRKIDTQDGKQTIIKNLYERFFRYAFKETTEKLGIVYTPVECVDWMIHSVNDVLKAEFGKSLSDKGVTVLDPFTGTGTFITRLLQSQLIKKSDLDWKYKNEIFANEIVLMAYYIADVNIETAYQYIKLGEEYEAFNGICLTDTFNLVDRKQLLQFKDLEENNDRLRKQMDKPIQVIIGNPPYSVAKDEARHDEIKARIQSTYSKHSKATNKNSVMDSYVQAFRWASDRVQQNKDGGIVAFISNSGWLDGNAMDGMRKCLKDEFTDVYVFDLRGNARGQGELRKRESGNVFGSGSRTGVAITILVYNPEKKGGAGKIHYHDIGDYLSQQQKLEKIKKFHSLSGMKWTDIIPNDKEDWINQRDGVFDNYVIIGDKKGKPEASWFENNSYFNGIGTSRDAWVYNFCKNSLKSNIRKTIDFFNKQYVDGLQDTNPGHISWSSSLDAVYQRKQKVCYENDKIRDVVYRPFMKINLYYGECLIHRPAIYKALFPNDSFDNLVICIPNIGNQKLFCPLISKVLPDLHYNGDTQCFPMYYYVEKKKLEKQGTLFDEGEEDKYVRKDGVTDWILKEIKTRYKIAASSKAITKEHVFYYVYGVLHSEDYRKRFKDDLRKSLPRIPIVEKVEDFMAFSKAGKELANLHLNYENIPAYRSDKLQVRKMRQFEGDKYEEFAIKDKMRYAKVRVDGKLVDDKTTIIFNEQYRIDGIPEEAYEYVVNGKSAIDWIMERYSVTVDKESGIKNDCNDWAREHEKPRYVLDLLLSVINVSVRTMEIVRSLPRMVFE